MVTGEHQASFIHYSVHSGSSAHGLEAVAPRPDAGLTAGDSPPRVSISGAVLLATSRLRKNFDSAVYSACSSVGQSLTTCHPKHALIQYARLPLAVSYCRSANLLYRQSVGTRSYAITSKRPFSLAPPDSLVVVAIQAASCVSIPNLTLTPVPGRISRTSLRVAACIACHPPTSSEPLTKALGPQTLRVNFFLP